MRTKIEITIALLILLIAIAILFFTIDSNGKITSLVNVVQDAKCLPE